MITKGNKVDEKKEIERLISELKHEYGLTPEDIAGEIGVSPWTLKAVRKGRRSATSVLDKLRKLVESYKASDNAVEQAPENRLTQDFRTIIRNIKTSTFPPHVIRWCAQYIRCSDAEVRMALKDPMVADYIVARASKVYQERMQYRQRLRQGDIIPPPTMETRLMAENPLGWAIAKVIVKALEPLLKREEPPLLEAPKTIPATITVPSAIASMKFIPSATTPYPKPNRPLLKYSDARCATCPLVPPIGVSAGVLSDYLYDNPCPHWERHECRD